MNQDHEAINTAIQLSHLKTQGQLRLKAAAHSSPFAEDRSLNFDGLFENLPLAFAIISSNPVMITIKVPCSSANIGPGFDVIGLALSIYLELHMLMLAKSVSMRRRI